MRMRVGYRAIGSRGFSILEALMVMALIALLSAATLSSLAQPQANSTVDGAVNLLIADLKGQQIKAMVGDSVTATSAQSHGISFQGNQYTLFKGTTFNAGDTDNYIVPMDTNMSISTTFPSSQVVFQRLSGDVDGFSNGSNTITIARTNPVDSQTITLNAYGAITVN